MNTGAVRTFYVDERSSGMRLDTFLKEQLPHCSRREIAEWIRRGYVMSHSGGRVHKGMHLHQGACIHLCTPFRADAQEVLPDATVPLEILYEDHDLVAVYKPAGTPTHPLRLGQKGTIANALVHRYPEMRSVGISPKEAGLLHRLDTDTSGIVLAALNNRAFERLRYQQRVGGILKEYEALVYGVPDPYGEIRAPIVTRGRRSRQVRVAGRVSATYRYRRECLTRYRCIAYFKGCTLVQVSITTGARHQIRCHLASIGHPIVGDTLYGRLHAPGTQAIVCQRLMLHAVTVQLRHPTDGTTLTIRCPRPPEFQSLLLRLST